MCANFAPSRQAAWERAFAAQYPSGAFASEVFPGQAAPILMNDRAHSSALATFGLLPHWARPDLVRKTYNARSETAWQKPSFREAWRKAQFCIVPADTLFEPRYLEGRAVRWGIRSVDDRPLGIAGLWESRETADGLHYSFTILTINADHHPVMKDMHRPGDEKRMVVILAPERYDEWLGTTPQRAMEWLTEFPAEKLTALPCPRNPR